MSTKFITLFSCVLLASVFAGCEKEMQRTAEYNLANSDQALLKVNYVSSYATNYNVHIKIDSVRVSNVITSRTPFPGGGFNTGGSSTNSYLFLSPGVHTIGIAVPKVSTTIDSFLLTQKDVNLSGGKNYTAHITDTAANTKVVLVEDILAHADTMARFKFVHLMPNAGPLDLYFGSTLVATNIPYLGVSPTFDLAIPATIQAWSIRETGTLPTSTPLATYTAGGNILRKRVYTAFASGYKGQASTSIRRPFIAYYLNK